MERMSKCAKEQFLKELFMTSERKIDENYIKPEFKKLTKEEVNDIHKRGKITPEEMVSEWEDFCLCAPGNSWFNERCNKFRTCHDCLVAYANEDEYYSIFAASQQNSKIINRNDYKQFLDEKEKTLVKKY